MIDNMDKALKQYRQDFEGAVNNYVTAFLKLFELNKVDTWWVGDRTGLDLFCFGDCETISLEDMVYCLENNITHEEYIEFTEYNVRCLDYHLNTMNLKAWHMGAPRVPQETFDRLDALKKELNDTIENTKKQF